MISKLRLTFYAILIADVALIVGFFEIKKQIKEKELTEFTQTHCTTKNSKDSDLCKFLNKRYR